MGTITRNFANNILGTGEVDATDGVNGTIPATNVADASLNNVTSLPSSVGYAIKSVASDPPSLNAGEIFYNSTAGAFKALVNVEAWSSGANFTTARRNGAGFGIQTSAVIAGGEGPSNATEEYNGSGWSAGGNLNTTRRNLTGVGTTSAGLAFGGFTSPPSTNPANQLSASEEYDGSSWTTGNSLPSSKFGMCSAGTQTAAFGSCGYAGTSNLNSTEEYDGTSWTAVNNNIVSVRGIECGATGSQTSAFMVGGGFPAISNVNHYDGTTWTAGTAYPTAISSGGAAGTLTAGLHFGGYDNSSSVNTTNKYDGSVWTSSSSLANGRYDIFRAGTNTSALGAGGYQTGSGTISNTEEFNSSTNTITAAAWASGGNLNTARYGSVGAGTSQDAALVAAGTQAPAYTGQNATEEYNGSTWTAGGNYPSSGSGQKGCGSLTAALGTTTTSTNTYDGSTWTNLGAPSNLNTPRAATHLVGSSTAGLIWGGNSGPTRYNVTEEWDGSTWTTSPGTLSDSVSGPTGFGIQTAALRVAGDLGPANTSNVDSYNGTTWTASTAYPIAIKDSFGTGTQTNGLVASGAGGPGGTDVVTTVVSGWDGSAWSTRPTMGTSRRDNTGGSTSGTATAVVQGGGNNPPTTSIANTEEFTGETITQVAKTLSSS